MDGERIAVALNREGRVASIVVIDLRTGERTEVMRAANGFSGAVAFSPSGDQLAAVIGHELCFWNATTFELVARLPEAPLCIAYGPRGYLLATSKTGGGARVYDTRTLQVYREFPGLYGGGLAFSPDGRLLAGGGPEPEVFDVASGRRVATLRGHTDEVCSVAFLPDGSRLASGSNDRTICLWDLDTFDEAAQLRGHMDQVNDLAFTPDGNTLFSCSGDYTVRMWDTRPLSVMLTTRNESEAISAQLAPRIRDLFLQFGRAAAVVEHVEADALLTPRQCEITNQLILREAMAPRRLTP